MLPSALRRKLRQFCIRSPRSFHGIAKGNRRSLDRGVGIEFTDYRPYEIGDDLRNVDWNVYARSDRLFLKQFNADKNLSISVLVDNSRSMDFGNPTKLKVAKQISAGLSSIALANFDLIAIYTLSDQLRKILSFTSGDRNFHRIETSLNSMDIGNTTDLNTNVRRFASLNRKSGVVFLISDFLDPGSYKNGLKYLVSRDFEVCIIHIISEDELNPQFSGDLRLEDVETGQIKEITVTDKVLENYKNRVADFCDQFAWFCLSCGITYIRCHNQNPMDRFFLNDLRQVGVI